jgi:class 3 adenylate cyclase
MSEERKLVTLLFADVTGSTTLGASLDPEDVRALMARYYAHARRIIPEHGGMLEKFIGDAVMAIFGLPHAHEDDAERALAAALALHEAVATDAVLSDRLQLRIGINTGEVVATSNPSDGDFLVTGDAVNVAARLQQGASPGEMLASERTAIATNAAFLFGESRILEVKGKREPLRVFPLRGARMFRQVSRPPFVGRQQDLLQLSVLQMRVWEERRPQLVSIVAPAGIGKTRLLEEFLARLDSTERFQVATARCLPYGQHLTYWPLRGLLTGLLGAELEQSEHTKERAIEIFSHRGYGTVDAIRLAELLLSTLGMEQEGTTDRERLFAAWHLLIEARAQEVPLILVFEDLHWASENLLDLVEHFMHPRASVPLLLIVLSRPELLDRRSSWGGGRGNFTALALDPLSLAQTEELVCGLMAGPHQALRERIVERSGGNPFFAIELVRGLAERDLGGRTASLERLPDTVHAAVLARLDLLSPCERTVMQAASVVGGAFRSSTLQAILDDYAPTEVEEALQALLIRALVVPAEGETLTFRHILIRDVAYGTLTRTERVRLHARIAVWLESYASDRRDEFMELIAYHYREAVLLARQAAVPLELPFAVERAVAVLERAGLLAGRSCAVAEARSYLLCAIELAAEQEHLRLYEHLGDALLFYGYAAVDPYWRAVAHWRQSADRNPLVGARLLRKLLTSYLRWIFASRPSFSQQEVIEWLAEAERLAEVAGEEDECWHVRLAGIWWLWWRIAARIGKPVPIEAAGEGRMVALRAGEYFEHSANWAAFSDALDAYIALSLCIGALEDAVEASQRRLNAPELPGVERASALHAMALSYIHCADFSNCIQVVREMLARRHPDELLASFAWAVDCAVAAAHQSGQWSEMPHLLPALQEIWEHLQQVEGAAATVALGYFCVLDMALAHEDHALTEATALVLDRSLPVDDSGGRALLAACLEDKAQYLVDAWNDDLNGHILLFLSEHGLSAPPALIASIHSPYPTNDIFTTCYAEIAEALAAGDDARLHRAIEEADTRGVKIHAARMRIVLALRTKDRTQLERARPVLEQLGDRRSLRRLEEVAVALKKQEKLL